MALENPFKKSLGGSDARGKLRGSKAAAAAKDALATVRANAAKKIAAVNESAKKSLAKARDASHQLAIKAKEPLVGIVHDEGVRIGGHVTGYAADRFIPIRGAKSGFLNVILRPSMGIAVVSFLGAMITKGETRFYSRSVGQGALHQVTAVGLRALDRAFGPNADNALGDADEGGTGDADL